MENAQLLMADPYEWNWMSQDAKKTYVDFVCKKVKEVEIRGTLFPIQANFAVVSSNLDVLEAMQKVNADIITVVDFDDSKD